MTSRPISFLWPPALWDKFCIFVSSRQAFCTWLPFYKSHLLIVPKAPTVIGTNNNSQFHRRLHACLFMSRHSPVFFLFFLPVIMSTFVVAWRRDVYYCTTFWFLVYSLDVRSVMRSILMFFFIGTFKTSTLEPGNTLTRSTVFLFSLFPVQWMFYPVNKLIGCICNCAQFFSSLPKLNYFVQEILTSEERSRFHVETWQKIETPWPKMPSMVLKKHFEWTPLCSRIWSALRCALETSSALQLMCSWTKSRF